MTTEVTWKKVALAVMVALPLIAQAVVIDNGIPIGNVHHLSVDVLTGGATESVVFTMRRYNLNNPIDPNDLITHNVVSSYRAFVDPGNDGHGFALHGSDPVRRSDNSVSSTGAFTGANGNTIHWEAVSSMGNFWPPAHLKTTYTFTVDANTPGPIGPLRVYQYLDGDIGDHNSNVFGTIMNASAATIATFDAIERFGVAQVGGILDASFAGLAADSFDLIRERIMGSGQPVAQTNSGLTNAEINLPLLDDFSQFSDFTHYGPGNIVSVLAWDINPDIDDPAKITSSLAEIGPLVPHHPGAAPAREQFSCQLSGCVVPVTCSLLARCDAKVEIFVGTAAYPFNNAVASEKFAVASATIQPDATVRVRPKLTKRGKSILRKKRNKKIRGLMEIRNASTGILFSSTRVRIRLK